MKSDEVSGTTSFDQATLEAVLAPRPVRYRAQTGSTNDDARSWLLEGAPTGAICIADEQLQGRGRLGRTWHAPPGTALLCSVVLHPPINALHQLTMIGALAVCDLAAAFGVHAIDIKWPNDVRCGGRKLSGVLPEAAWDGDRLLGAVLGIGINISVDFSATPLAETAISLEAAARQPIDRLDALRILIESLARWTTALSSDMLFEAWRDRLALGLPVQVTTGTGVMSGTAEDAAPDGALLLRLANGELHRVLAGDIHIRHEPTDR